MDQSISEVMAAVQMLYRGEAISITDIQSYCELQGVWDVMRFVILVKFADSVLLRSK